MAVTKVFVTVGTELPFDRLVAAVDDWAASVGDHVEVFAQVGESSLPTRHIKSATFIEGVAYDEKFQSADLIVAHAGMGTILSALRHGKALLVMPRHASLGEHRNEHQVATANRLSALGMISVAFDVDELIERLDSFDVAALDQRIGEHASASLIDAVRNEIVRLTK